MWRTGKWVFTVKNWIFMIAAAYLFTYAQGGEEDFGVYFTVEPTDVVAVLEGGAALACAAAVPAPRSAHSAPRLSWRHALSGVPTREHAISNTDKHRKQLSNGSLVIENMSPSLAGQYQCVASVDGVGTIVSRVATVFLASVPPLSGGPLSVLGVEGSPALLPCPLRAAPRPAPRVLPAAAPRRVYSRHHADHAPPTLDLDVTWLRNGIAVRMEGARVTLLASGALELDPLRADDAGKYACRVALAHRPHQHRTSEEIELRVSSETAGLEYAPRFIATPQPVTVLEGATVTFDCAAVGNPKPEMVWLNNGVAIDLSDLDSRFYLVGSGSLVVQGARALDAGAYTCRATNRLDSTDHGTTLNVLSPPRVQTSSSRSVLAHLRGSATLQCSARGKPPPTVTWLKDGDPLTPNHHDITLVDGTSLRIVGVLREDAGMFQCAAHSPAGDAQAPLRLHVAPSPKGNDTSPNPKIDPKVFLNALQTNKNLTQDIFDSLISTDKFEDFGFFEDDLLGETSPSYTQEVDYYFHAAEGIDLVEVGDGNSSVVSPPRNLRAVIVKHRFVTLSWEEPERCLEEITGYAVVYRAKGSERWLVSLGAESRRDMTVAGLQPNVTYLFTARALTAHAASPPTQMLEVSTPEEELTYGPPQLVRVEATGPHTLRVWWAPPAPPDGAAPPPPPDKYTVFYTEMESGREQFQYVENVAPTTSVVQTSVGGLRAASEYRVRVAAWGGAVGGGAVARTPAGPPAAPPANVTATVTSATSILVRWEAPPARSHRGPLTGYKLRYRPLPPPPSPAGVAPPVPPPPRRKADSLTTPADTRRAELKDLDTHTTYQIRVCALNANGSGPFSEWVTASTRQQQLDESVVPPPPPPLNTKAGRDWISVWWSEGGSAGGAGGAGSAGSVGGAAGVGGVVVRGWWLGWGLGVPDEHARDLPAHAHSHVIRSLESNSEYVISLRASNALGLGPAVYATVRTRPAGQGDDEDDEPADGDDEDDEDDEDEDEPPPLIPPVGVKAIMLSGTTAVVYWTDPTLPKGQPATDGRRYVVRWSVAGGTDGTGGTGAAGKPRYFNATDLNCMLDDLKPFTTYEFAVKLIKGARSSAWSMLVSNTSLEAPPATAPRDVRAAPAPPPHRAALLSWAPPARPNGIITGYVIMYAVSRSAGGEEWAVESVPGAAPGATGGLSARLERLRARTTYVIKLQARNSRGLGPFSAPILYTTASDAGGGSGGLAAATSAWLWASAGGACAVLALAAALALSLCCRRSRPPLEPDTSTYQKSSASAGIKPPDLWIHHDQMELKHIDKSLHSSASKISAGSVETGVSHSTLTLGRPPAVPAPPPAEYEYEATLPRHAPASLDRRHYVPTYVESRSSSRNCSDDASLVRSSPSNRYDDYIPMSGVGVGVGVGCVGTCERRFQSRHPPDQSTPLLSGMAPLGSPQSTLPHHAPPHCSVACPLGPPCGGGASAGGAGCAGVQVGPGGDIYACAARERGHYVAYEPLGHYSHRDSLSSDTGGSLQRRGTAGAAPGAGSGAAGGVAGGALGALHSFTLSSDTASAHSTPSHGKGSIRETSPYKKSASSSPGHLPNRLQLGGAVPHCSSELEPLTPSRSTERLHREMQNLEGLMKDLSAITQQQFHC